MRQKILQPKLVEFELPVMLLRLAVDLPHCQETVLEQTGLPCTIKIDKRETRIKFIFEGNGSAEPFVEMVRDIWRLKITDTDISFLKVSNLANNEIVKVEQTLQDTTVNSEPSPTSSNTMEQESDIIDGLHITSLVKKPNRARKNSGHSQPTRKSSRKRTKLDEKLKLSSDNDQGIVQSISEMKQFLKIDKQKTEEETNVNDTDDILEGNTTFDVCDIADQTECKTGQNKRKTCNAEKLTALNCPGCDKVFNGMPKLLYHVRQAHQNQPDYEEIKKKLEDLMYEKSSRSRSLIVQNCSVCGRERRGITLLNHLKVWHTDCENYDELVEKAKTQYTKNKLAVKLEREKHLFQQQMNICPYCSKELAHRASYRKHVMYTCELNPERKPLFNCNVCGYSSPNSDAFQRHQQQHETGAKFTCSQCGKEYSNRSGLVVHQRDVHKIVKKAPIQYHVCHVCQQKFYCKNHYERHIRTHNDDRPMQCDLCGKRFKHSDHLNRHRREIHQNQYRYRCEKCGHGMEKLSYLKAHKCGRVRRTQSSKPNPAGPNQIPDTVNEVQSSVSESQPSENSAYGELFSSNQVKPEEDFAFGMIVPVSSADMLVDWMHPAGARLLNDDDSTNVPINVSFFRKLQIN